MTVFVLVLTLNEHTFYLINTNKDEVLDRITDISNKTSTYSIGTNFSIIKIIIAEKSYQLHIYVRNLL